MTSSPKSSPPSPASECSSTDVMLHLESVQPLRCLAFVPRAGVDYAQTFAKAVFDGYMAGTLTGPGKKEQMRWAHQILTTKRGGLIFRQSYVDSLGPRKFNGLDERKRKGAFIHILGTTANDCVRLDCRWRKEVLESQQSGTEEKVCCQVCKQGGHFEECRHCHEVSPGGDCSNCRTQCKSNQCTHSNKDEAAAANYGKKRPAEDGQTQPRRLRPRRDNPAAINDAVEVVDGLPASGPFFHQIFPERNEFTESSDLYRVTKKAVCDLNQHALRAEIRWMAHYLRLLMRELRDQDGTDDKEVVERLLHDR